MAWNDHKAFTADLKTIYRAATQEEAEMNLLKLAEKWGSKYAIAIRSWKNNWEELTTFSQYPTEIRRLIYTSNTIEGYHRQLCKVMKNKAAFPTSEVVRKLLYLVTQDIAKKWTMPIQTWANILNQVVIRFGQRLPV